MSFRLATFGHVDNSEADGAAAVKAMCDFVIGRAGGAARLAAVLAGESPAGVILSLTP